MIKSIKRLCLGYGIPIVMAGAILLSSCNRARKVPEGVLSRDEMVKVLSELYLSEQKVSTLGVKRDSLRQIFEVLKDRIFEKAGTTDSLFKRSLDYYANNPQTIESIYASLIDSLNLQEQRLISREELK